MILIVDDRPENIFSLKSILELHSFDVDAAAGGEEALKKTLKQSYALIILDVQMPGMDGFEVAELLSGNLLTRDIPIIFLSAVNTDKRFITKGYSSGAIDYITKPIDADILLLKVKTFHRLYEQNRELISTQLKLKEENEFRKKAQAQVQEKAKELDGILAAIPQVAFTATPAGKIDFVNDRWYAYSALAGVFPSTHPEDPDVNLAWKLMLTGRQPLELELRIARTGTADYRFHLLRVLPVVEHAEVVKWVGTFTDIDEQKQVVKRKDEFLSIASHELKTPLTSIKAYVQLLEKVITVTETSKNFIDRTLIQVNKLDSLINDLLDISKIENGKLRFDLEPLLFGDVLSSTLDMLAQIYPDVSLELNEKTDARVLANAMRLEQVIINFISNAVKYAPNSKHIQVITRITPDRELYFGVRDFGIGIQEENLDQVFGKFFRVSDDASQAQGLGIGLYICAEILKRHNARLGVSSDYGNGSLFYFTMPLLDHE